MEGYNFKFTNIQSAIGISQLEDLEKRIMFLTDLYDSYRKAIYDCEHQRLLPFSTKAGEFPLWPEISFKNKKEALNKLDEAGIGYREIWHPISTQKPYFSTHPFPNSTALSESTIWLPSSFQLSSDQVTTITKTLECEICQ